MKKVCVFIGSRANYASITSTLYELKAHKDINLQIIAGASALSEKFGNVSKLIKRDGFKINSKIYETHLI